LLAVGGGGEAAAAGPEVAGAGTVGGEEALGVSRGFEASQASLPLERRLMGVLGAVVESFVPPMFHVREDLAQGGRVARERVRDHHARHLRESLEQLAQELHGRLLITPGLHQDVEHMPVLIDGPPEVSMIA